MRSKPNIILINCDDLGWGDPSCYGHPRHHTPNLDSLATEGTRFTDFYMGSPVCSPSRAAMLTGCYPQRVGFGMFDGNGVLMPGQPIGLDPAEDTIPRMLKRSGYATHMVGKWHCGDQPGFLPLRHGFDDYYGLPYSNDMGRQLGGGPVRPPLPLISGDRVIEEQPDQASLTARYTESGVRFITEHRDVPFFLYFAHMYVHLPVYVPDRFMRESSNGAYGAAVAAIDWSTGVLLATLRRLGIEGDTLVLFTSDNGSRNDFGDSNGPLRGVKGTTWEGGQRVPLLARWPGRVPAGRTSRALLSAIDLLPTIASVTASNWKPAGKTDGLDASALLLGESEEGPRKTFAYYNENNLEAVRFGTWKLHLGRRTPAGHQQVRELYDLSSDVGETVNRHAESPAVVAELSDVAAEIRAELGDETTGDRGDCRPIGRVAEGKTLTTFDPEHPYFMAEYDIPHRG